MTEEMYERRRIFADVLSAQLTAKEIAMILYSHECEFCAEQKRGTTCSYHCTAGIREKAIKNFSGYYDFKKHKEIERGNE